MNNEEALSPGAERDPLVLPRRALAEYREQHAGVPDDAAALTGLLAELQELARFMKADFTLILGRGYLIHTRGERPARQPAPERPLSDLASAPESAAAHILATCAADDTSESSPQGFTAAAAELLSGLVTLADYSGIDFEKCLIAASDKPRR